MEDLSPFLGTEELDNTALTACLPEEKLQQLQSILLAWQYSKVCTKWEVLSLLGVLPHVSMVVQFRRAFIRCMIELAMVTSPSCAFEPKIQVRFTMVANIPAILEWN